MSESVRLLSKTGSVTFVDSEFASLLVRIDGEIDPITFDSIDLSINTIVVHFNGAADGRGFSQVSALRNSGFKGLLYAGGLINPDQLTMAFQTGFDGVLVSVERWEDYSEESWQSALIPIVNLSYALTASSLHRSIWQTRHCRQT